MQKGSNEKKGIQKSDCLGMIYDPRIIRISRIIGLGAFHGLVGT